jgi:hypothetical protein
VFPAANESNVKLQAGTTNAAQLDAKDQFQPFYVLCSDRSKNKFTPTGWMGDTADIKVGAAYIGDRADLGKSCMKINYLARGKKRWASICWQYPINNWGNLQGGRDLTGAKYLTFWAKGEKGGEDIAEFKMGGIKGKYPDLDTACIGPVKLNKEWTQYKIDLKKKNLKHVIGGFCFTVLGIDNRKGCSFYLAQVKYE